MQPAVPLTQSPGDVVPNAGGTSPKRPILLPGSLKATSATGHVAGGRSGEASQELKAEDTTGAVPASPPVDAATASTTVSFVPGASAGHAATALLGNSSLIASTAVAPIDQARIGDAGSRTEDEVQTAAVKTTFVSSPHSEPDTARRSASGGSGQNTQTRARIAGSPPLVDAAVSIPEMPAVPKAASPSNAGALLSVGVLAPAAAASAGSQVAGPGQEGAAHPLGGTGTGTGTSTILATPASTLALVQSTLRDASALSLASASDGHAAMPAEVAPEHTTNRAVSAAPAAPEGSMNGHADLSAGKAALMRPRGSDGANVGLRPRAAAMSESDSAVRTPGSVHAVPAAHFSGSPVTVARAQTDNPGTSSELATAVTTEPLHAGSKASTSAAATDRASEALAALASVERFAAASSADVAAHVPEAPQGASLALDPVGAPLPFESTLAGLPSGVHEASTFAKPASVSDAPLDGATRSGPAAQAAPVLLSLATRAGTSEVNLKLTPDELGHMHVRITRDEAGGASVTVTAERPATLALLVGDQAALHRALDKAGVSVQDRSLTFHLSASDKLASTEAAVPSPTTDAAGRGGSAGQGWTQRQGGGEHATMSGESGQQRREPARAQAGWTSSGQTEQSIPLGPTPHSARTAVDITA